MFGLFDISHLEVDVTDASSRRYHFPWFCIACTLFSQAADIDRIGSHLDHAVCPTPCISGTITIDFQTIAIRVRDIQRFTHQMIALTDLPANPGQTQELSTKVCSRWEEDGYVIEARCSAWLRCGSWN